MIVYEQLIQPIKDEQPCGVDIRQDNELLQEYLTLKELRNELRREERKNIEIDNNLAINKDDWKLVVTKASAILTKYTKDVEVAVWLLEGLTRTEEFQGLNTGFQIISYLFENYSEQLYPVPEIDAEADDFHPQLAPISMLGGKYEIGTLIAPIYFCELIRTNNGESYNGWELKKDLKANSKSQSNTDVTKEDILQSELLRLALDEIDNEQFLKIKEAITNSIESFKQLNSILTSRFERQAPNLSNLSNALNYCFSVINAITKTTETQVQKVEDNDDQSSKDDNKQLNLNNLNYKQLDKKSAIKLLDTLALFFAESEPHSPIAYSLARALNWSKMTLPEILGDLISDQARDEYCRISGVPFLNRQYKED